MDYRCCKGAVTSRPGELGACSSDVNPVILQSLQFSDAGRVGFFSSGGSFCCLFLSEGWAISALLVS